MKREDLIEQMKSGQTVNVDGYEISYKLFKQASAIDLAKNAPEFAGDVLIVQIGKEEQPIRKDLQDLADTCNNCDLHKAVEETFWREIKRYYGRAENLFDVTLSWMESKK